MIRIEHLKYLEILLENEAKIGRLRDAACAVVTKAGTEYEFYLGKAQRSTIYRIFSMTKPFVAAGIYLLLERGEIALTQKLSEFYPFFRNPTVWTDHKICPAHREVRLMDLMHMVSGIAYPGDGTYSGEYMQKKISALTQAYEGGNEVDSESVLRAFADTPLIFQPGEQWHYGASADILGSVIEKVSRMDLAEFFGRELLEPLNMKNSGFWVAKDSRPNLADIYTRNTGALEKIGRDLERKLKLRDPCKRPPFLAGGSGLYSTLSDYAQFVRMLLGKGEYKGRRVLGKSSIMGMASAALREEQRKSIYFDGLEGYSYGNLMRHLTSVPVSGGIGTAGEFGWDGLLGNDFFVSIEEGVGFIFMQQIAEGADYTLRRKMRQIVYGALER